MVIALAAVGLLAVVNSAAVVGQATDLQPAAIADRVIGFIPNGGQWDDAVAYHAAPNGVDVWLTARGYVLAPGDTGLEEGQELAAPADENPLPEAAVTVERHAVKVTFDGAAEDVALESAERLPGEYNWLIGPESDWVTGLGEYRSVTYRGVWPGIDATVRTGGAPDSDVALVDANAVVKWHYTVGPGADPYQIRLRYEGADSLSVVDGKLRIGTQLGNLTETGLIAWQDFGGERKMVPAAFVLDGDVVSFQLEAYEPGLPLVIDPVVVFSRRFGGTSTDATSNNSLDALGNIYTSGWSLSTDYPTLGGYQAATAGSYDCVVTKTNPDNSALIYSTYLGSTSADYDCRSTLTPANEVIVAAMQSTTTWVGAPTLIGTGGGYDVGLAILNAAGNGLVASARVGGTSTDYAHGVARMSNGNIVVSGTSFSTTGWPALGGARPALIGSPDGFAVVVNSTLTGASAFSYLGGSSSDYINAVALDASNNVYVHYSTLSTDQTLIGGPGGNYDVGVAKLNSTLTAFSYNVRFGGTSTEPTAGSSDTSSPNPFYQSANSMILVDGSGQAWVTGMAASTDFPTTPGAYKVVNGGNYDVFVTKLNAAGSAILASTFIGGTSTDAGRALALDGVGRVYVVGSAASTNYPTTAGEVQTTSGGGYDYIRSIFSPDLSTLVCSTYYGGSSTDYGSDFALKGNYRGIINGSSASTNFPQRPVGAPVIGSGGGYDITNSYLNCGGARLEITGAVFTNRGPTRVGVSPVTLPPSAPLAAAVTNAAEPAAKTDVNAMANGGELPMSVQQLPENEDCLAPGNFVQITIEIANTGLSDQLGAGPEYIATWDSGLLAGQAGSCAFFVGDGTCTVSASRVEVDADIPSGATIQFAWLVRIAGGLRSGLTIPIGQTLLYDTDDDGINEPFPQDPLEFTLDCVPTVYPNHQLEKQVHLPILNFQGQDDVCESWIEVQNLGCDFAKAALVTWGEPGFCPPQAAGPLKVECTGMLKPGSTWNLQGAQVPTGSKSGILFKLSANQLSEDGIDVGFDDITGDYVCELLFFGVVGDADDYRRFKKAYNEGLDFQGVDMERAAGEGLLAVDVHRSCPGDATPGVDVTSKYNGLAGTHLGTYDDVFGGYSYYVPLVYASAAGFNTILYLQNGGLLCSSVEIWFKARDDCLRATICDIATLAPGETFQLDANDCVGPDFQGSAWIRSTQVLGIAVDIIGGDVLMTYVGEPGEINYTFDPNKSTTRDGNQVAFGPLLYSEYQGWDSGIQVQNLSPVFAAKVKVYFLDRSGDIITTLVDWVCPRGSQTFFLPVVFDLPGNWVGSSRAESQEWISPGSSNVLAPNIVGVATLIKYTDVARTQKTEAIAYNLLPEHKIYDWQLGFAGGGLDSGIGLIAIPSVLRDLQNSGLTTEIAIANVVPKPGFTDLVIYFYDQNGLLDYVCQKLNEKQVEYIDLQTWGYINDGFKGSAVISAWFWEHDVFDDTGFFLRNLVGLGAVSVERKGTHNGEDIPGDESAGDRGIPFAQTLDDEGKPLFSFCFMGPAPLCPGFPDLRPAPGEGPACVEAPFGETQTATLGTGSGWPDYVTYQAAPRVFRDGVASTCNPKACPGTSPTAGIFDLYYFNNCDLQERCVTVTVNVGACGTAVHAVAFTGSVPEGSGFACTVGDAAYIGDLGSSVSQPFSFTIPAGTARWTLMFHNNFGPNPCGYSFTITEQ